DTRSKLEGKVLRRPAVAGGGKEVLPARTTLGKEEISKLEKGKVAEVQVVPWVSDEVEYLSADEEDMFGIAQANASLNPDNTFVDARVPARARGHFAVAHPKDLKGIHANPIFEIVVKPDDGSADRRYPLQKFYRSNQGTCLNHRVIVQPGQKVEVGDILADGPAIENGEMALGRNVLV